MGDLPNSNMGKFLTFEKKVVIPGYLYIEKPNKTQNGIPW